MAVVADRCLLLFLIHQLESNGIKRQLIIQRTEETRARRVLSQPRTREGRRSQDPSINTALQILVAVDIVHSAARRPEFRVGRDKFLERDETVPNRTEFGHLRWDRSLSVANKAAPTSRRAGHAESGVHSSMDCSACPIHHSRSGLFLVESLK